MEETDVDVTVRLRERAVDLYNALWRLVLEELDDNDDETCFLKLDDDEADDDDDEPDVVDNGEVAFGAFTCFFFGRYL